MTFVSSEDQSIQPYRLFIPSQSGSGRLPLVVVLHGRGVDHNAWMDLTPINEFAQQYNCLIAAPFARGDEYYIDAAERDVLDVIKEVKLQVPVDTERIYLAGHSMGGWGTWRIALRNPDMFAAISPMSGMAPHDLLPNALHLAPFVIHDVLDDVIPVDESRKPVQRLVQLGISVRYREEHEYGHESRLIGDNLGRILDWFNGHKRVVNPRRVNLVVLPGNPGKAYWLEVLRAATKALPGSLYANFAANGTLYVTAARVDSFAVHLDCAPRDNNTSLIVRINGEEQRVDTSQYVVQPGARAVFNAGEPDRKWNCELREN